MPPTPNFYAYAGDSTLTGRVDFEGQRPSHFLEQRDRLVVEDATVSGLRGEPPVHLRRLTVARDELYAVEVGQVVPRDERSSRRIHTVRHVVRLLAGPYTFVGELHTLPGTAPMQTVLRRRSMVPLTECAVVFNRAGMPEVRRTGVVIVNGALVEVADTSRTDVGPALSAAMAEHASRSRFSA